VAHGLAKEGVHILLCARDEVQVGKIASEIATTHGVMALGILADLPRTDDISRVIAKVEETFSGADILIDNAGTGSNDTILNAPDDRWQFYWEFNVMDAVRLARGLVPLMLKWKDGSSSTTPPFAPNSLSAMNPSITSLKRPS
jgi:3-oxoacyl-[acyl-carrier protein] reductase